MKIHILIALLAGILITSSCLKDKNKTDPNPINSCTYDACQMKAPDSQVVRIEAYLAANNLTAVKHCSGMFYTIVTPGSGESPTSCSDVAINYTGMFTNGNVFDKSTAPAVFNLGQLITGWKNGLPLLKRGGKIKLYIPPALGYGQNQNQTIPGNSILIFDIDLLDFSR